MTETMTAPPPHDLFAEQSTLGAMLMSKDAIGDVLDVVRGEHFYVSAHALVFDVILALYDRAVPADVATVAAELQRAGNLQKVGGHDALYAFMSGVPTALNGRYYAEIVREKAILRDVATASLQTYNQAQSETLTGEEMVAEALSRVERISTGSHVSPPMSETFEQIMDSLESGGEGETLGYRTGLLDLDLSLNGFRPGELGIVAARPGVGKSVLLADFARDVAYHQGGRSLIISLEMSRPELFSRVMSAQCGIPLHKFVRQQPLTDEELAKVAKFQHHFAGEALQIEFAPGATLADVRSLIRRHRPDVVFVDYLQLMTAPKAERRELAVGELSRGLKVMAQRENVPVWVASQLNRESAHRSNPMPVLTDLRESGSLEQDADVVLLLHREDAYNRESSRPGEADIIIAKQRNGISMADVTVAAQMHYARFRSMSTT